MAGMQPMLKLEDSGIGILPADLPNVFQRFYRGETDQAETERRGTGSFDREVDCR